MVVRCPKCSKQFAPEDMNPTANIARCLACNEVFALSELAQESAPDGVESLLGPPPPVDLNHPPSGVTYEQTFDGVVVSASTRSCTALFLIPFMCLWSGGSLGAAYGSQISKGKFDLAMTLFGLPFLIGTIFLGMWVLMSIVGRVEVRLRGGDGEIFTGVGPIGWTDRFQLADVTAVREHTSRGSKGSVTRSILIEGPAPIKFGSMLSSQRREFLLQVLKKAAGK